MAPGGRFFFPFFSQGNFFFGVRVAIGGGSWRGGEGGGAQSTSPGVQFTRGSCLDGARRMETTGAVPPPRGHTKSYQGVAGLASPAGDRASVNPGRETYAATAR